MKGAVLDQMFKELGVNVVMKTEKIENSKTAKQDVAWHGLNGSERGLGSKKAVVVGSNMPKARNVKIRGFRGIDRISQLNQLKHLKSIMKESY